MPMSWNDKTDAKLLTAIIKIHAIKINYEKVAELMGPECTAKAISHRIQKLKGKCKGEFDHIKIEPLTASDVWVAKASKSSPVNTPSSVATATPTTTTTAARGRGRPPKALKRSANSDDEGGIKKEMKERGSPTPKKKKAKVGRPRKNLPDSPNSSFEPARSSGSSPATAAEPVTPSTSTTRRLLPKPLEEPNFYFDDVVGGEERKHDTDNNIATALDKPPPPQPHPISHNVKPEIDDEDADVFKDLPAFPILEDFDGVGPADGIATSFMGGMNMSFDFAGFPDWSNFASTDDSFLTYNE